MQGRPDFHDAALRSVWTYRRNPLFDRSFQIFRKRAGGELSPYASYMVLDPEETPDLSERKVMNLVSILNGKNRLLDLGARTGTRTLYHVPPRESAGDGRRVVFYTLHARGVSRENALLAFEPDAEIPLPEGGSVDG